MALPSYLQVVNDQTGELQPAGSVGSSVVLLMVRDAYANYVVQTTLDVVPECEEKRMLLEELNAHSTELVSQTAGYLVGRLPNCPRMNLTQRTSVLSFYFTEKLYFRKAYHDKIEFLVDVK